MNKQLLYLVYLFVGIIIVATSTWNHNFGLKCIGLTEPYIVGVVFMVLFYFINVNSYSSRNNKIFEYLLLFVIVLLYIASKLTIDKDAKRKYHFSAHMVLLVLYVMLLMDIHRIKRYYL